MTDNELTPDALGARVSKLERQMAELQRQYAQDKQIALYSDQFYRQGIKQVIWRTIIFALVMAGAAIAAFVLFPISSR